MAHYNQDWDDLGRSVQDIIDRAVSARDYQKLDQTIRQVVNKAVDMGGEAVRKVVDNSVRPASNAEVKQGVVVEKKNLPVLYGSTNRKTAKGVLKIVGGGLLSFATFMMLLSVLVLEMMAGPGPGPVISSPTIVLLIGLVTGVGLIGSGTGNLKRIGRFKTYRKILGEKTHCTLEKLARGVGKTEKFVRRELQKMIGEGLFLQGHMDKEQTRLITSDETFRQFEQSRLQLEERQCLEAAAKAKREAASLSPQVQEVLDRGDAYIAQIRKCNDDIPGVEISEKIYRIEKIVQRIFQRAEAHPEVVPDLKKMMDYYLPMTVKLLNAYADMDAQPVQGETILSSKREIEATLDTLNLAFEKLLDDLFQDTAMDVSSDISVLKTLLAQEGLAEDELSKMKKQRNS